MGPVVNQPSRMHRVASEPIVWLTGSAFGLKLILNVEQYEYMKGPNNDAGVKVQVHERPQQ